MNKYFAIIICLFFSVVFSSCTTTSTVTTTSTPVRTRTIVAYNYPRHLSYRHDNIQSYRYRTYKEPARHCYYMSHPYLHWHCSGRYYVPNKRATYHRGKRVVVRRTIYR